MKIRKIFLNILTIFLLAAILSGGLLLYNLLKAPPEVRKLRSQEVAQSEEGHQEYYFGLLSQDEKRGYRELLEGIRNRKEKFYLTVSGNEQVDRIYHAVLKDHPELFWVHNRKQVYKTVYGKNDYCQFSPEYSYNEEESAAVQSAMEQAYSEVLSLVPEGADDYEKVKTAYTWLIDNVEYKTSQDDQSIAGAFWKREAVCAGYARALQYLLERMNIPVIYVEGSTSDSGEGHAWNIVSLDGAWYYVDATNGDQPDFLEGDAVQFAEHKTTIYDYLCPFPAEYEKNYQPSTEFAVPSCTKTDKNFYVLNDANFEIYDWESVYALCRLRLDNGAAVVRFKFASRDAFQEGYQDLIEDGRIQEVAQYYMDIYGMSQVEYHYGILENLNTMYFMF